MRRTIVFICMCSIVGFCAVANSQQREPQQVKPGLLGRMLGLKSIPNPRALMKNPEQMRAQQQQQRYESQQQYPPQYQQQHQPRQYQQQTSPANLAPPVLVAPHPETSRARSRRRSEPTSARRTGLTTKSYLPEPVITGSSSGPPVVAKPTPLARRRSALSLENVLKNRLSQPLTSVNRTAPWVVNPFRTELSNVYQPIASGPVPAPEVEVVVTEEEPLPYSGPMTLQAPIQPTTELAAPDTVIVAEPQPESKPPVDLAEAPSGAAKPQPLTIPTTAPALEQAVSKAAVAKQSLPADREEIVLNQPTSAPAPAQVPAPAAAPATTPTPVAAPAPIAAAEPTPVPAHVPVPAKPSAVATPKVAARTTKWKARTRTVSQTTTLPYPAKAPRQVVQESTGSRPVVKQPVNGPATQPTRQTLPQRPTVKRKYAMPVITPESPQTQTDPQAAHRPTPPRYQPASKRQVVGTIMHGESGNPAPRRPVTARTAPPKQAPPQFLPPRQPGQTAQIPVQQFQAPRQTAATESAPIPLHPIRQVRQPTVQILPPRPQFRRAQHQQQPVRTVPVPAPVAAPPLQATSVVATPPKQLTVQPATRRRDVSKPTTATPAIHSRVLTRRPVDRRTKRTQLLASRPNMLGFKGFCPVQLRDNRQLLDSSADFYSSYGRHTYYFSSADALASFVANPRRYVPAAEGRDVVLVTHTGEELQGKLDYAAWYQERLFLFTSESALKAFNANPAMYADRF